MTFVQIGVIKKNPVLYSKLDKYLNCSWMTESLIVILQHVIEIVLLRNKLAEVFGFFVERETDDIVIAIESKYAY